ncbi:MAG TPA: septal ring lytic transglycosylase RlpA family protein [Candidatus Marinimicrobia bacterium]|nr:septal ring lytic transglycosylase RlpA family protein [Candidatus Neomarinimicrobiota bacterium]HIN97171.1 septal ring lytic transglycosylase RlpA family protein [Candidatus Neomarinimicrobiota bacterium]
MRLVHKYILPIIISLSGVILVVNCSSSPRYTTGSRSRSNPVKKVNSTAKSKKILKGISSYYGEDFHGKLTANGEVFDMYGLTAAHKTLPLNTIVRVTNLENKKSLILRINDRGPYVKGRMLDCSYGAALKLGFIGNGTTKVKVEVIELGDDKYMKHKE